MNDDERLSIGEVAEVAGLSTHTLRYYERIGLLPQVQRLSNGHRRYLPEHVHWLGFLQRLRSAGMGISKIRQYVNLYLAGDEAGRMYLLAEHHDHVARKIQELQDHLAVLDDKLKHGCSPDRERRAREGRTSKSKRARTSRNGPAAGARQHPRGARRTTK